MLFTHHFSRVFCQGVHFSSMFVRTVVYYTFTRRNVCSVSRVFLKLYITSFPRPTALRAPRLVDILYIFSIVFFLFSLLSLYSSFFNDMQLDVMVGRKYLTATVGEIRTYFFPPLSDANPSVRYARSTFYSFFFLL